MVLFFLASCLDAEGFVVVSVGPFFSLFASARRFMRTCLFFCSSCLHAASLSPAVRLPAHCPQREQDAQEDQETWQVKSLSCFSRVFPKIRSPNTGPDVKDPPRKAPPFFFRPPSPTSLPDRPPRPPLPDLPSPTSPSPTPPNSWKLPSGPAAQIALEPGTRASGAKASWRDLTEIVIHGRSATINMIDSGTY